jgi:hypothetical protein
MTLIRSPEYLLSIMDSESGVVYGFTQGWTETNSSKNRAVKWSVDRPGSKQRLPVQE